MRALDGALPLSNATATTSAGFTLFGGVYVMDVVATGAGTVTLQRLGPDGLTQIPAFSAMTGTGTSGSVALPAGVYTVVTAGLTAVYASIARVPGE